MQKEDEWRRSKYFNIRKLLKKEGLCFVHLEIDACKLSSSYPIPLSRFLPPPLLLHTNPHVSTVSALQDTICLASGC